MSGKENNNMKELKDIIQEAVTPKAMDRLLMKRRQPIQSQLKGDIGEYVLTLERMLDIVSQTSTKTDEHLKQFLQQWDRERARQAVSGQGEKKKKSRKKKKPSVAAPIEEPSGEDVDLTDAPASASSPESAIDIAKDMPTFSKLAKQSAKKSVSPGEIGTRPLKQMYGDKMVDRFTKGQNWNVGSVVDIGFAKKLKITGGDKQNGWQLVGGTGTKYLFVPSKTPKMGRGLYKVG